MKIIVCEKEYSIEDKIDNLLDILNYIKMNKNKSLAFKYGCKSGVCGSCAVVVNGVEKLSCVENIENNSVVQPLKNLPIIKDLVVDNSNIKTKLNQAKAYLDQNSKELITQKDIDNIDLQSNCILCNSCYSSCPVFETNSDFIGPFALTRAYRYLYDKKEEENQNKLDAIQKSGVWDCTLCGACSLVCPAKIDIKTDIMKLQNLSVQNGYENPLFSSSFNSFDSGFSTDFTGGFNPNGF